MEQKDAAPREYKAPLKKIKKGLLVLYTGDGKGKTTAGFGAVFRSLGRGYRVAVVQFIKGKWISGEVKALKRFGSHAIHYAVGDGFTWDTKNFEQDAASAKRGWELCVRLLRENKYDLYLFDELLYVLKYHFLSVQEVLSGLKEKPDRAHVILTGRDAPSDLIAAADLVSDIHEVKHPFKLGIPAQPGIDY